MRHGSSHWGWQPRSAAATAAEQRNADEARCRSYGFKPGAEGFANCLMEVDLDRSASRRARLEASGFYGPYWGPWPYRRW